MHTLALLVAVLSVGQDTLRPPADTLKVPAAFVAREVPDTLAPPPAAELPPLTTTYLLPNGRLVVVPAGEPLPADLFAPAPQYMPSTFDPRQFGPHPSTLPSSCPGGVCPVQQSTPARRGWFR